MKRKNLFRLLPGIWALTLALVGPASAATQWRVEKDLEYAIYEDTRLAGDLYIPAGERASHPVVIMIHGGGWNSGKREDMKRLSRRVAEAGIAVFNITYRLAPRHRFPAQLEDLKRAVLWLEENAAEYNLDPDRIGAWGFSAGAHLALLLGTVDRPVAGLSQKVSVVIAGAPPTDLREYPDSKYVQAFLPESADSALFRLASPVANVDEGDAPAFLYHGKRDRIVWIENSIRMARHLERANVDSHLYELTFGHYLGFLFSQGAVDAGVNFLKKHFNMGEAGRET